MSDDLNFFDDPIESTYSEPAPLETPSAEPAPSPAPEPSVTPEQFQTLQRELESERKWKQDMGRMLLGEQGQQQPNHQDPNTVLQQFLSDPNQVLQQTSQQAVALARQEMETQAIIQDRKAKHPDIAQMEHLINWEPLFQQVRQEYTQKNNGQQPAFADLLDGSITLAKTQLQGFYKGSQAQEQGNAVRSMAMNLDLSGGQAPQQKVDPFRISDADWPKQREAYRRQYGGS